MKEAEKVGNIVKTGISDADVVIGTSHAFEIFTCKDHVCGSLNVIGSVLNFLGIILGNIPATKKLPTILGFIPLGCRAVRYYCKEYGTFWGCTISVGTSLKEAPKIIINKK